MIKVPRKIRGMAIDIGRVNFSLYVEEVSLTDIDKVSEKFKKIPYKERSTFSHNNNTKIENIRKDVSLLGKRIFVDVKDFTSYTNQPYDDEVRKNLLNYLDSLENLFLSIDFILIEKQYHNPRANKKSNMDAITNAEFVYAYFFQKIHKGIYIKPVFMMYYPSKYKTEMWGAPKKQTKYQRKKWASEACKEIFSHRKDEQGLKELNTKGTKADDMSDCVLMWQTFICSYLLKNKK